MHVAGYVGMLGMRVWETYTIQPVLTTGCSIFDLVTWYWILQGEGAVQKWFNTVRNRFMKSQHSDGSRIGILYVVLSPYSQV